MMDAVYAAAAFVWSGLESSLVHGTVLAIITWLLTRTLLRNARPALVSALWSIVLIKFLVPVGPEVPLSLSGSIDSLLHTDPSASAAATSAGSGSMEMLASPVSTAPAVWTWLGVALLGVYGLMIIGIVLYRLRQQRRYGRWARSLPPGEADTQRVARRTAAVLGLPRVPDVRVSADVAAPQIVGIVQPIVVVPERTPGVSVPAIACARAAAAAPDEDRERVLEAMLLHEFAHLRRRDTWLRVLQLSAATLFFFWPIVRWVNRQLDEQREMACDQWVLAHGRISAAEYARTLVTLARHAAVARDRASARAWFAQATPGQVVLGMALARGHKQLSVRVHALMRGRSRPRVGLASGIALVLFAAVSLGRSEPSQEQVPVAAPECVVESGLIEYLMHAYPEADVDGDGELSLDEVCAQKRRLAELGVFETQNAPALAEAISHDPVLASLDAEWLECQSCGCAGDASMEPDFFEKKVCTTN